MGFFDLFKKQPVQLPGEMPAIRGVVEKVLVAPADTCFHEWREIHWGGEWNEARYGPAFQPTTPKGIYADYRSAYHCRLCGGEFVTVKMALI